ncbi:unnamed protein product [Miscanthus lutarioriparius]|uniref:Uncharacterized protein n=1 Tax=Miscanthus lutarioriparius TaxID=422564 RepID=A0A811S7X3_9POAL|nr:unnamed protein product [Miscanthus lutarioriparius]
MAGGAWRTARLRGGGTKKMAQLRWLSATALTLLPLTASTLLEAATAAALCLLQGPRGEFGPISRNKRGQGPQVTILLEIMNLVKMLDSFTIKVLRFLSAGKWKTLSIHFHLPVFSQLAFPRAFLFQPFPSLQFILPGENHSQTGGRSEAVVVFLC